MGPSKSCNRITVYRQLGLGPEGPQPKLPPLGRRLESWSDTLESWSDTYTLFPRSHHTSSILRLGKTHGPLGRRLESWPDTLAAGQAVRVMVRHVRVMVRHVYIVPLESSHVEYP